MRRRARAASAWRRLAFLPVLALLLGALGLFAAGPAQAERTVTLWSAMLDVQSYHYTQANFGRNDGRGCREARVSTTYRCRGALTDDSFSYGGRTYRVAELEYLTYVFSGTRRHQVNFALDGNVPAAIAQRATLVIGSTRWSLADSAVGGSDVYRNGVVDSSLGTNLSSWRGNPNLPASGRVRVSLEMPAPYVPYAHPSGGTVWSATLDVQNFQYTRPVFGTLDGRGCVEPRYVSTTHRCRGALTDDSFSYGGQTYRVTYLHYLTYVFGGNRRHQVHFAFDRDLPAAIANRGVLVIGSTRWPLANSAVGGYLLYRNGVEDFSLTDVVSRFRSIEGRAFCSH